MFFAGAGAGVYTMRRWQKFRDSLSVAGLQDRAKGFRAGWAVLNEEFSTTAQTKEAELTERYLSTDSDKLLPAPSRED